MIPDLDVDTVDLRSAASALSATASRVIGGARAEPAVPKVPRWSSTDAAVHAGDAARARLIMIGDQLAETARQMVAAAGDYEASDARAADRLRLTTTSTANGASGLRLSR